MNLNSNLSAIIGVVVLLVFFVPASFGHGDDGKATHKKDPVVAIRIASTKTSILGSLSVEKILKDQNVPRDVLIATCSGPFTWMTNATRI